MVKTGNTLWHCFNIEFKSFDRILLPLEQPSWCGDQCVHFESCPHFVQEVSCPDFYTITVLAGFVPGFDELGNAHNIICIGKYLKKWKFLMAFAIKRRPPPFPPIFTPLVSFAIGSNLYGTEFTPSPSQKNYHS